MTLQVHSCAVGFSAPVLGVEGCRVYRVYCPYGLRPRWTMASNRRGSRRSRDPSISGVLASSFRIPECLVELNARLADAVNPPRHHSTP